MNCLPPEFDGCVSVAPIPPDSDDNPAAAGEVKPLKPLGSIEDACLDEVYPHPVDAIGGYPCA